MAKTVGTSDLLEVLGSNRVANGAPALVTPSLTTIETGFISGIASSNNLTWASTVLGEKINHVLQNGVPQWVSTTTYAIGNVVNRTNSLWIALASNTNSAPTVFNANWTQVQSGFDSLTRDIIQGTAPVWASTTTITMGTLNCLDSLRTSLITCSSATLNFATTGLNGLDAGSIASNTWYYIYAILNPTTLATGFLASTSASSPTLPSGFTKFRLLPLAVKTKTGSAVLMRFSVTQWGTLPTVRWMDAWDTEWAAGTPFLAQSTMDNTYILSSGNSTSFVDVSTASFCPPFSKRAEVNISLDASGATGNQFAYIRQKGTDTNAQGQLYWRNPPVDIGLYKSLVYMDSAGLLQYKVTSQVGLYIGITAYQVTEVVG